MVALAYRRPPSKTASFLAATVPASKPASSPASAAAAFRKKSPFAKIFPKAASAFAAAINTLKAPASKSPSLSLPALAPSSSPSASSSPNPSPPPASTATAPPTSSPPSTPDSHGLVCHLSSLFSFNLLVSSFPFLPAHPYSSTFTSTKFAYDAAGNMTQDGKGTGYSYSFDGENRLGKATGMTGGPYCYVYDGNGLRVAKKSGANSDCSGGTVARLYWRSIAGDAMAETDGSGNTTNAAYSEYVFFAGRRVASRNGSGGIFYWFADHLGSTRTITTGSGTGQTPGQLC